MVQIGSQSVVVHGPNSLLTIGANTFGSIENWDMKWNYKILEEAVSNSQIPLYAASTFHGDFTCDAVLTSDNNWLSALLPITNGDLAVVSFTLTYKDVSGTTKVTTCQGRFHDLEQKFSKGEFTRYALKCVLSAIPTGF